MRCSTPASPRETGPPPPAAPHPWLRHPPPPTPAPDRSAPRPHPDRLQSPVAGVPPRTRPPASGSSPPPSATPTRSAGPPSPRPAPGKSPHAQPGRTRPQSASPSIPVRRSQCALVVLLVLEVRAGIEKGSCEPFRPHSPPKPRSLPILGESGGVRRISGSVTFLCECASDLVEDGVEISENGAVGKANDPEAVLLQMLG